MSRAPGHRPRVGLELPSLELNKSGTARAVRELRRALEELGSVDIEPLGQLADMREIDVLHCPSHLMPARSDRPLIVTLNDVRAWRQPESLSRGNALQHELVVRRALRKAAAVLTPSQFPRRGIIDLTALETAS